MDLLKTKTVTATSGTASVGVGLSHAQILGVWRQGEQKDDAGLIALGSLNGSNWVFIPPNRVSFGTSYRFSSEQIQILYKVTI